MKKHSKWLLVLIPILGGSIYFLISSKKKKQDEIMDEEIDDFYDYTLDE